MVFFIDADGLAYQKMTPPLELSAVRPILEAGGVVPESPWSRRQFIVVAAAGLAAACEVVPPHLPDAPPASVLPARLRVRTAGRITTMPIDEYVVGSIVAEVSPQTESAAVAERIFQVQAVLARSYAATQAGRHRAEGFDLCDTSHCQLFDPARLRTSRFAPVAHSAVERTRGLVLTYERRPAGVLFHADCGGQTAAADAVWGGSPVPYLVSAADELPSLSHREWTRTVATEDLRAMLNADARTRVGRTLSRVEVVGRDVSGRAAAIALDGEVTRTVRGEELRAVINQRLGATAIQSTRFAVQRTGGNYVFRGTGFGHGVGLCQAGAAARARRGASLEEIFGAYFKGARLDRLGT